MELLRLRNNDLLPCISHNILGKFIHENITEWTVSEISWQKSDSEKLQVFDLDLIMKESELLEVSDKFSNMDKHI